MKGNLALLERQEIDVGDDKNLLTDAEIDAIADGARDPVVEIVGKLGYTPPSLTKEREEKLTKAAKLRELKDKKNLPLARTLKNIGIKPFTPDSVQKYKAKMVRRRFQIIDRDLWEEDTGWIVIPGIVLNSLIFALLGNLILTKLFAVHGIQGYIMAILPLCSIFCGLVRWENGWHGEEDDLLDEFFIYSSIGSTLLPLKIFGPTGLVWNTILLSKYNKDIPRPVLENIAEIHARCPQAYFMIDELGCKPDPFLVVKLDDESYHIEVWNEPRFDGIRAA